MDLIGQILRSEMERRLKAYITTNDEMVSCIPRSYLPVWRSFVVHNLNWLDNTEDDLPDDSLEIFYRVPKGAWVYDFYTENPEVSFDSLEAILSNGIVQSHLDISQRMAEGQNFPFNRDGRAECCHDMMQYASFLLIDDQPSWMYCHTEPYRESSTATENVIRAMRSLTFLRRGDEVRALEMARVRTVDDYVRRIIFPFISASMAWNYMDTHENFFYLDDEIVTKYYSIPVNPKPEWNLPPSAEFKAWCEEDCRQQWERLGKGRKVTNSLNCSVPPLPVRVEKELPRRGSSEYHTAGRGGGRGSSETAGRGGRGSFKQDPMPNYTKGTSVPPLRILEGTPPMIMRRRDARPSVMGESEVLMGDPVYGALIYESGKRKYSVCNIVEDLPALLQNPAKRDAYMQCEYLVFERPIREMPVFFRKQFCEVLTSLCLELATKTTLEERHATVQKYHGLQREDESLEQYYFNFSSNAWDAISMLYGSLKFA